MVSIDTGSIAEPRGNVHPQCPDERQSHDVNPPAPPRTAPARTAGGPPAARPRAVPTVLHRRLGPLRFDAAPRHARGTSGLTHPARERLGPDGAELSPVLSAARDCSAADRAGAARVRSQLGSVGTGAQAAVPRARRAPARSAQ